MPHITNMQNIIALVVLVLVAHVARAADETYAPHVTAADSRACEAKSQTVSACSDTRAEPCDGYWETFEACMSAVENAGPTR